MIRSTLSDQEAFPFDFSDILENRGHVHALGVTDEALKALGYEIETAGYFAGRTPFRWQADGSQLGITAVKPE